MPSSRVICTAVALLIAATGSTSARPVAATMTCEAVRDLIQSRRAVVFTTGRTTYERFVRPFGNECDWPEVPMPAFVLTRDGKCLVHRCEEPAFAYPGG